MRRHVSLVLFGFVLAMSSLVAAQSAPQPRMTDDQIKKLLEKIDKQAGDFRGKVKKGLAKSMIQTGSGEASIYQYDDDFKVSVGRLKDSFDANHSVVADVEEVLRRASYLDRFMDENPVVTGAGEQWAALRGSLDQLAYEFNVTWRPNGPDKRPTRLTDRELKQLLDVMHTDAENLRRDVKGELKHNRTLPSQEQKNVESTLKGFSDAIQKLGNNTLKADATSRAKQIQALALSIDRFMGQNSFSDKLKGDWSNLRARVDQISASYHVTATPAR